MACYYKVNDIGDPQPMLKGLHLQKIKKFKGTGPTINFDFSKHVLIELLDDSTPESIIWNELGLTNNKNVIHKRIMIDSHRIKCRRAIIVCVSSEEAKLLAQRVSQTMIMNRCVCAVVVEDLLSDLCLFEKQIIQFGDTRPQQQLLYVSDLNRCREPSGLVKFLKEKFSPFGTILCVLVCPDDDGYAYPEGVIKFAYLSEAFAAELALDQYVIGKERLSVTAHHNILLSQCDLRVRLRAAQWSNRAESFTCSESHIPSNGLNNLSTFEEDPVVNSIMNLHISSDNIKCINNESTLNNVSIPDNHCPVSFQHEKNKSKYLRNTNKDSTFYNKEKSLSLLTNNKNVDDLNNTESCVTDDSFKCYTQPVENIEGDNFSFLAPGDTTVLRCISSANVLSSDRCTNKSKLNLKKSQDIEVNKDSKILESSSFENCDPNPHLDSSHFSSVKTKFNSFQSDDLSAMSEYYSSSSRWQQVSSLHNGDDSENKRKLVTNNSKKRKKHFTPSQKLCLKSQRICSTQNSVQSTNTKSELSTSSQSNKSVKSVDVIRDGINLCNEPSNQLPSLPVDVVSSKVTNWLAYLPSAESISLIISDSDKGQNFTTSEIPSIRTVSGQKKHKNRISVHNTPSLKSKSNRCSRNKTNSNKNSTIENEDPDEKTIILSKENIAPLQDDDFSSPLQVWLKHELLSAANFRVIKSQETTKRVIVCAAKTKDVIISVGCSHMTCEFCYPQSTDLLLGFSQTVSFCQRSHLLSSSFSCS